DRRYRSPIAAATTTGNRYRAGSGGGGLRVPVDGGPDEAGVVDRGVVREHPGPPALAAGGVAAVGAEVAGGGERGVVELVGVAHTVAVAVGAEVGPGGGQELHRADGPVERGVAVEAAAVGVPDLAHARGAVER